MENYSAFNPPMPFTDEFYNYVQSWDVVVVWDKDHTMVDSDNILRPNLETAIIDIFETYPQWKHVILTENSMASVEEMFENCPAIRPVFDMILSDDNYFSRNSIKQFFRKRGDWWVWGRKLRKERTKRKKRRVNDIFLGKKVVLIDDLRDGRIPEHSFSIICKVWTGEASHKDEIDWPFTIKDSILRVIKNLYHYKVPPNSSTLHPS